ncbi:hypothetical protein K530_11163 [Streptomyces noursei CCRC 11814]|uniref:Uncharacterized protein n=1 Tax=Streptomyces noursei TaxID=1971 RepID=A0A401R4R2_STRNR|nr:hypothetical protein K530_11163 [Streptomyces noursei CCRC 11814]GCB92583.1 hypothetical protein SALB_05350 [Streptomyces noursei]
MPGLSQSSAPAGPDVYVACLGKHGERYVPFLHNEHAQAVASQWGADHPDKPAHVEKWDRPQWEHEGPGGIRAIRDRIPDRRLVHHAHAVFLPGGERLNIGRDEQWSVAAWEFETDLYTDLPVRWNTVRRPGQEVEAQVRGTDQGAVTAAFGEACAQAVDRARNPGRYGDLDAC